MTYRGSATFLGSNFARKTQIFGSKFEQDPDFGLNQEQILDFCGHFEKTDNLRSVFWSILILEFNLRDFLKKHFLLYSLYF